MFLEMSDRSHKIPCLAHSKEVELKGEGGNSVFTLQDLLNRSSSHMLAQASLKHVTGSITSY